VTFRRGELWWTFGKEKGNTKFKSKQEEQAH
jgi:hypothetical protein